MDWPNRIFYTIIAIFFLFAGYILIPPAYEWIEDRKFPQYHSNFTTDDGRNMSFHYDLREYRGEDANKRIAGMNFNIVEEGMLCYYDSDGNFVVNLGMSIDCFRLNLLIENNKYRAFLTDKHGKGIGSRIDESNYKHFQYPNEKMRLLAFSIFENQKEFIFPDTITRPKTSARYISPKLIHISKKELFRNDRFGDIELFIESALVQIDDFKDELVIDEDVEFTFGYCD